MKKTPLISLLIIACLGGLILGGGYFYLNSNIYKEKTLRQNAYTDLVNGNYKASLAEYTELYNLDHSDPDVVNLRAILASYLSAQKSFNTGDYTTCLNILDGINSNYKNYPIKDNIDRLKHTSTVLETIDKAKASISNGDFSTASTLLDNLDMTGMDNALKLKVNSLKSTLSKQNQKLQVNNNITN